MKKWLTAGLLVGLFCTAFYLSAGWVRSTKEQSQMQRSEARAGEAWEKINIMTKEDHARLVRLRKSVGSTGITAEDFTWIKSTAESALISKDRLSNMVRCDLMGLFLDAENLKQDQREWAYQYAVRLVKTDNLMSPDLDKSAGIAYIRRFKDKRGIPHLLPLLQHPAPRVRERTAKALAQLGYGTASRKQ